MPASYSINRYTRADRIELFEFLTRVYAPAGSALLKRQWDWKYDNNPFNREDEPFLLLMRDKDSLIGMLGAIPLRIAVRGIEYPIVHGCDLVVAPEYRGARLSERLLTEYMRPNPVGFGWLNERSHRRASSLKRTGWTRMTPLIKPLNPLALLYSMAGRTPKLETSLPVPLTDPTDAVDLRSESHNGIAVKQFFSFDARFDTLWNRVSTQYPVIGVRDSRFLNWRYAQRPDVRYLVLAATKSDELLGYLVVRLSEKNGMRVGYFVDIIAANPSDPSAAQLIAEGCKFLKMRGASAGKCLVTTPRWRRKLFARGFLPQSWGSQPYFHSRSDRTEPIWQVYRDVKSWYLTMGDGDFEISL